MTVPPGFRVELVASEPEIVNPVAMTFDERGRAWITESLEYPRKSAGPGRDRIKVLEDTDGDGKADKFTVFADGLNIPSGIAVGYGGVWVANSPRTSSILRDTDGDGVADKTRGRRHRLRPRRHPRIAQLPDVGAGWVALRLERRLQPGPDVQLSRQGKYTRSPAPSSASTPVTRAFEVFCEGTSNPWGIAWNDDRRGLRQRLRHRPPLAPLRDRVLPPPGRPLPPLHLGGSGRSSTTSHQKAAYCGITLFRQRRLPREVPRPPLHGQHPRRRDQRRSGRRPRTDPPITSTTQCPTSSKPTTPGSCLWSRRPGRTGRSTSSTGTTATTAIRTPTATPHGIDRLKGRLYRVRYEDTPRSPQISTSRKKSDDALIARLKRPERLLPRSSPSG